MGTCSMAIIYTNTNLGNGHENSLRGSFSLSISRSLCKKSRNHSESDDWVGDVYALGLVWSGWLPSRRACRLDEGKALLHYGSSIS